MEWIAYRFGQERMPLQWFIGVSDWDHEPLRDELVRQVGEQLGEEDGVIVFDPSGFPKSGKESVGVARQWCGRLGKVDNCQVAVYMGYVSSQEHALVDTRLLPAQGVDEGQSATREGGRAEGNPLSHAASIVLGNVRAAWRPAAASWIAGDDEMGRPYWFRQRLNASTSGIAGRAIEHADPRLGSGPARLLGSRSLSQTALDAGGPVGRGAREA